MTFEEEGALHRLEGFASEHGPAFYGLAPNSDKIVLERWPMDVPAKLTEASENFIPFHAGETLPWRFAGLEKS